MKILHATISGWMILAAALVPTISNAEEPGIAKTPPATGDGEMVETPGATVDPAIVVPPPKTEATENPVHESAKTGVCVRDGKTTADVNEDACKNGRGTWRRTPDVQGVR